MRCWPRCREVGGTNDDDPVLGGDDFSLDGVFTVPAHISVHVNDHSTGFEIGNSG